MATALAAQLQKLAVPQTTLLQRDKKRASLLFDPKVAASIDRETFYDIGISGLKELEKYNSDFAIFENSLFSATSRDVERSVENKDINLKLDKNIQKFLFMLSPYFVIKPAHKALEWLIHRFSIHEYNREDFLKLILPYHETNVFTKCIQLFNVRDTNDSWHWLRPLQKNGIHLSRIMLFNHCASNVGMLKFIGEMTINTVDKNGSHAGSLTTLFSFYCTTTIGALEHSKTITEPQISAILPAVLKGLSSDQPDFTASSYMIIAELTKRTKLTEKLLSRLVYKIVKNNSHLRTEATLLLLLIYQTHVFDSVPTNAMEHLVKAEWFTSTLCKLVSGECYVLPLLIPVLRSAMQNINQENYRKFVDAVITDVRLKDSSAGVLINTILDNFHTEEINESLDIIKFWYSKILKRLETQYPNPFDSIVNKVMSSKNFDKHRQALRCIMNFVMSSDGREGNVDIFEKLYHPNAEFRVSAIHHLVKKYDTLQPKDKDMLKGVVGERLLDDNVKVVMAVFKLTRDKLIELLGQGTLNDILVRFLMKAHDEDAQLWSGTIIKAINMLCDNDFELDAKIFLAVVPYVFPVTDSELPTAFSLLNTNYAKNCTFLSNVKKKVNRNLNSAEFCEAAFKVVQSKNCLPENCFLLEMFENLDTADCSRKFIFTLLMSYSLQTSECTQLSIKIVDKMASLLSSSKVYTIKHASDLASLPVQTCMSKARDGKLCLQGMLHCLNVVVTHTSLSNSCSRWLDFQNMDPSLTFILKTYVLLLKGCESLKKKVVSLYTASLKQFMSHCFPTYRDKLEFFSNFLTVFDYEPPITPIVQLNSISAISSLLNNVKQPLDWILDFDSGIIVPSLLIGLSHPVNELRQAAMKVLVRVSNLSDLSSSNSYHPLLQRLVEQKEEILMSSEQLSLIMYNVLMDDKSEKYGPIMDALTRTSSDLGIPYHINSKLLNILLHIGDFRSMMTVCRLGTHILRSLSNSKQVLDYYQSNAFYNVVLGLNKIDLSLVKHGTAVWELIELSLKEDVVSLEYERDKYACPSVLILEQITYEFFNKLSFDVQASIISLLADMATTTENADVVMAVSRVVKKIPLDAKLVIDGLTSMKDAKSTKVQNQKRFRNSLVIPTADILDSTEWKRGTTYLEFIQNKKKLTNCKLLLPLLFGVLKKCLDFDEQSAVEYPKQLLLSSILHCCEKMQADAEPVAGHLFNMDLVVQCIRASQNPQTHHHALLVLARSATFIPDQVLHNIMAIFTFMGSSVLRHDDAYSFQIISKIIDTVIPILVSSGNRADMLNVLRVFVDVVLDVPEHRRMPLFIKLLTTLGVDNCLWLFLVLVFQAHIAHDGERPKPPKQRDFNLSENVPKRLDIAANITLEFSPRTVIHTCIQLMQFLKSLPVDKEDPMASDLDTNLLNVKLQTVKQFRHFKYTLVVFISNLLSSKHLVNQVALLSTDMAQQMELLYKDMIVCTLTYIQSTVKVLDRNAGTSQAQYWKVIVHYTYDILDSINALLTTDMFLLVVQGLLAHNILTVRRKSMELLNQKLQYQPDFFDSSEGLFSVLPALLGIVQAIGGDAAAAAAAAEPEQELNQQTALLSLKLLVRLQCAKCPDKFIPVLHLLTDLIRSGRAQGNILASVVLCLAELCASLRAHAIPSLVMFMPAILRVLRLQKQEDSPTLLLTCLITAIQKIVESLPLFLSPYLEKLLVVLCSLSAKWQHHQGNKKLGSFISKLRSIQCHIGRTIPPRILVPIVGQSHQALLDKQQYGAIEPLMNVLVENIGSVRGAELAGLLPDLTAFFLPALQFRADRADSAQPEAAQVHLVEGQVIGALTALVLKLSETAFRPFYYKLYDWAVRSDTKSRRVITFYRLSHAIAESLKGLFVLFAGHFINNAAQLLDQCNAAKAASLYFPDAASNSLLAENILRTLHSVFLYDSQNFVDKDRFETLMQPLVDQLENTADLGALRQRAQDLLVPCVAQFAVATADDSLWKQLNYQILLKTRHDLPTVRLVALGCLCEVANLLGEDFLPLLPETIPFLAELLEDEDEAVEAACQKAVQGLEKVLGEPLQKYF